MSLPAPPVASSAPCTSSRGDTQNRTDVTVPGGDPAYLLQHTYTYDLAGNRATKAYYATGSTSYTVNAMNELTATSGTRGNRVDVTGTVSDANIENVEITASHVGAGGSESRSPVWGWVRGGLFIGRGIELWNDTDNSVKAQAFDRNGNSAYTTKSPITLSTAAAATLTWDDNGCLANDGTYKYAYDYAPKDPLALRYLDDALARARLAQRVERRDSADGAVTSPTPAETDREATDKE